MNVKRKEKIQVHLTIPRTPNPLSLTELSQALHCIRMTALCYVHSTIRERLNICDTPSPFAPSVPIPTGHFIKCLFIYNIEMFDF